MDDLVVVEPKHQKITIEHIRLLKAIRRGGGEPMMLRLRFAQERAALAELLAAALVEEVPSGWPGVPGYRLSEGGHSNINRWLKQQRADKGV